MKIENITVKRKYLIHLTLYILFASIICSISPFIGSEQINFKDVLSYFSKTQTSQIDADIFINLRIPRIILGFLAGGTLALVGCVFQAILRNPLATPYTLGVTGGSAVGAYLAIAFPALSFKIWLFTTVQIYSLIGACAVLFIIYYISKRPAGISMATLLLAGVTIGILCGAFLLLIRYITKPNLLVSMDRWIMGSLDTVGYKELAAIIPLVLPGIGLLFFQTKSLDHLSLGQELAMGHGIDVIKVHRWCFIGGSLATAGIVSVAGPIAFVGLIIPHCVRRLSGFSHKIVLPGAFLAGGAFLVACDTITRTIIAPGEMPVGIMTALIGGLFFIYLLTSSKVYE